MNTENNIAAQLHQKTIDLQAVIIANQQRDIDRLNSLAIDSAAEIARLNKVIEWLQGQTGKMLGAAAKAEIAGAAASMPQPPDDAVALAEEVARLQNALCFWLPSVTDREDDIADRILQDAFLLVGCDGNMPEDFKSAQELGWIIFGPAASPSPAPAQQPANLADALDRIALLHENNPEASLDDKASLLAHACTIARVTLALVTAPAKQQEPARIEITINGRQLRDALEAAWTERSDPDEGDTELTLFVRDKAEVSVEGETMEPGLWFYWTDYPEEGVCYLDPNAPETSVSESVEPAAPGSSTEGKQ